MSLPQRVPGASGYQTLMEGSLSDEAQAALMVAAITPPNLADPEDPQLWEVIRAVLERQGIEIE